MKGLPEKYDLFKQSIKRYKPWPTFGDFKELLKREDCHVLGNKKSEDMIMKAKNMGARRATSVRPKVHRDIECFKCGRLGHMSRECRSRTQTRWCIKCKKSSHNTELCRYNKGDSAKSCELQEASKCVPIDNMVKNSQSRSERPLGSNGPKISDTKVETAEVLYDFAFKASEMSTGATQSVANSILVDSGASSHIVKDLDKFESFEQYDSSNHMIELADGSVTAGQVEGRGRAVFYLPDQEGVIRKVSLRALYMPKYKENIFAVPAAVQKGVKFYFASEPQMETQDGTMFDMVKKGKLYYLDCASEEDYVKKVRNIKTVSHTAKEWHRRLGHCNMRDVMALEKVVTGMNISKENLENYQCRTCIIGKQPVTRNREPDMKASAPFEFVHTDLTGAIRTPNVENAMYAMTFVDDYSGMTAVYLLRNKTTNAAIEGLKKFMADIAPHGTIKRIRCDNGTEYTSKKFRDFLVEKGIKQEFSSPDSPHQNGTAERSWRTLFDMARCLLEESKVCKSLWPYAVKTAAYIRNRCLNRRLGITAHEAATSKRPDLQNLQLFGSKCYVSNLAKPKLGPRCIEGIFVGYDSTSPAYLVFFPDTKKIGRVRAVTFTETFCEQPKVSETHSDESNQDEELVIVRRSVQQQDSRKETDDQRTQITNQQTQNLEERRCSSRIRKPIQRLGDELKSAQIKDVSELSRMDDGNDSDGQLDYLYRASTVPNSYEEAISSPKAQIWRKAMDEQIKSLENNDTYSIIDRPEGRSVIGSRWVFSIKPQIDDTEVFKARVVAKGYSQIPDIDYQETFSPTARMNSVRMLAQLSVEEDMEVHQMDFDSAYLNAELDTTIFMEAPPGLLKDRNKVLKLNKSLYGLKQSGRLWNNMLHNYLEEKGFLRSNVDNCVYTLNSGNSKVILIVWVDDLILASNDRKLLNNVKSEMKNNFSMKDLGKISYFLGIEFNVT